MVPSQNSNPRPVNCNWVALPIAEPHHLQWHNFSKFWGLCRKQLWGRAPSLDWYELYASCRSPNELCHIPLPESKKLKNRPPMHWRIFSGTTFGPLGLQATGTVGCVGVLVMLLGLITLSLYNWRAECCLFHSDTQQFSCVRRWQNHNYMLIYSNKTKHNKTKPWYSPGLLCHQAGNGSNLFSSSRGLN